MTSHRPVMLEEAVAGLAPRADGLYVDCTFGRGGHSRAILDRLGPRGVLHALDQDPEAVAHARSAFAAEPRLHIHHRNFSELRALSEELGIAGHIAGVLMDLGVSSPQFDSAARGFSFAHDGPLDMRMNPAAGESATQWLARAPEAEIADVLWRYGEERNSRRIARRIVDTRAQIPITTTAQLAALIASVPGPRSRSIHPATRSFQAIRIQINRELEVLETALAAAIDVLAPGGRLVVISFHSLEDRIVKHRLRDAARSEPPRLRLLGKQFPSDAECAANPRARSAVLRIAERVAGEGS
ncbi:16S rRNA (cytosine(1402)-N(4))-methyltransferase RsmH [Fontimonas sp. SYSU GA230001]|uniref:16S rRNA (cytosine(1402)-N(4))-methyltransferase RsmH n=1 Tax=Fontimonas sp. SYSU GA230001 TaxID=3142450 RepID=UPI0032B36A1A